MKKQILYTKFISRIFATTLDLFILSIISIVINMILIYISVMYAANPTTYKTISLIVNLMFPIIVGLYFIFFWRKFGATPGKIFMCMRIVNADDYSKPSMSQLVKRFFGYITAPIGMWSILFNKKSLALHDKIAGTVVIKR